MSIPMSNMNTGGYAPPGYAPENNPAQFGQQQQQGYAPIPQQMPYGDPSYGGSQHNNAGQPEYGGQQQPYYGGQPQQYNVGGFQQNYGAPPPPGPILMQPGAGGGNHPGEWMSIPAGIPNCPRGLEYLASVDQLIIQQKVDALEIISSLETNNKYDVKNALGQKVYFALEDSNCCTRNMFGSARPFGMKMFDNFRNEVMHLERPYACSCFLFPCCLQKIEITAPPGTVIGSIEQDWTLCIPKFRVKNHLGDTLLRIEGPCNTFAMCGGDVDFHIMSLTGEKIGKISKKWGGAIQEFYSSADTFGITFPMDLDVRMKAVLLGATFLIDSAYYESSK